MKLISAFLIILMAGPAFARKQYIVCVNQATNAELEIQGYVNSDKSLGTLTLNSPLANNIRAQGIGNTHGFASVGQVDWKNLTFQEVRAYGDNVFLSRDARGGYKFVLVSRQFSAVANFYFNPGECEYFRP